MFTLARITSRGILRTFILFSLFMSAPTLASAATYYVAPNGSDSNSGTQAAPFRTLQKAHSRVVAGDTIYMRGGTYDVATKITFTKSGTSSTNRIRLYNYTGESPVLRGAGMSGPDGTRMLQLSNASWWHIKGIEMKDNPRGGAIVLTGASNNNILELLNTHHNGATAACCAPGVAVYDNSSNNLLLNIDSHHNRDATKGNADGVHMAWATGSGNIVRGNRWWRNSDDGIDLYGTHPSVLIENNWAWENGFDDSLQPLGNGNGFKLGGSNGAGDGGHVLKNNLSWKNRTKGYLQNGADLPLYLYNNTAWANNSTAAGDGGANFGFPTNDNVFKNNIAFGSPILGNVRGSATFNSWNTPPGVTVSDADFHSLDYTCARGPRQADGSLPNCPFLKLATGSDLINKGTNVVGIAFTGSAPDLGAFEFGEITTDPASGKFIIGDRVSATAIINVRATPRGTLLSAQQTGALGTVVGGPTTTPNGVIWWQINYDNGTDGWSGQDLLVKYSKFIIGDRVSATAIINVRATPRGTLLSAQQTGALGTVVGGPITTPNGVIWWQINYDNGTDGWSGQDLLVK